MTKDVLRFLTARLDEDEASIAEGDCPCVDGGLMPTCPERVFQEVEVKRRIVELHKGDHQCSTYNHHGDIDSYALALDGDCSTMRLLALPYADHPDYQREWKP